MAVTSGHGNPKWTREEVILALDLYFDCSDRIPSASDYRVVALSNLLRSFPHYSEAARKESFRNPDGVAFKLQNLRQVATGKGLGNVSQTDREVWDELGSFPEKVRALSALIRSGIQTLHKIREEEAEYVIFAEGRIVTATHLRRERSAKIRTRLISQRIKDGGLFCDICAKTPGKVSPDLAESLYEAHHILPLASGAERVTKLSDMALLCACCHRLAHRVIAKKRRWLSVDELRVEIFGA